MHHMHAKTFWNTGINNMLKQKHPLEKNLGTFQRVVVYHYDPFVSLFSEIQQYTMYGIALPRGTKRCGTRDLMEKRRTLNH